MSTNLGWPYGSNMNWMNPYGGQGQGFTQGKPPVAPTQQGNLMTQPQNFQPAFPPMPAGSMIPTPGPSSTGIQVPGMLPVEQSYIENIFRLNKGKLVVVYMGFEGSTEWNSKVFKGVVEAAGRDHLIISDPETGFRYLLPMVYFNYAVFEEEIDYDISFAGQQLTTIPPR